MILTAQATKNNEKKKEKEERKIKQLKYFK